MSVVIIQGVVVEGRASINSETGAIVKSEIEVSVKSGTEVVVVKE